MAGVGEEREDDLSLATIDASLTRADMVKTTGKSLAMSLIHSQGEIPFLFPPTTRWSVDSLLVTHKFEDVFVEVRPRRRWIEGHADDVAGERRV